MRKYLKAAIAASSAALMALTVSAPSASAIELEGIGDQLTQAYEALTGPVQLERTGTSLLVNYTNRTTTSQKCTGIVIPYYEVEANDLQNLDPETADGVAMMTMFNGILNKGESSGLMWSGESTEAVSGPAAGSVINFGRAFAGAAASATVTQIRSGQTVTWRVDQPRQDATGIIFCDGEVLAGNSPKTYFGIEPSILLGQLETQLGSAGSAATTSVDMFGAGSLITLLPAAGIALGSVEGMSSDGKTTEDEAPAN